MAKSNKDPVLLSLTLTQNLSPWCSRPRLWVRRTCSKTSASSSSPLRGRSSCQNQPRSTLCSNLSCQTFFSYRQRMARALMTTWGWLATTTTFTWKWPVRRSERRKSKIKYQFLSRTSPRNPSLRSLVSSRGSSGEKRSLKAPDRARLNPWKKFQAQTPRCWLRLCSRRSKKCKLWRICRWKDSILT